MAESKRFQKKRKCDDGCVLDFLHTDCAASNINFQDESAIISPLNDSRCLQKTHVTWCEYEGAETLPSDWLSDFSKHPGSETRYLSVSRNGSFTLDTLNKMSVLSQYDESSQGSDSGLGNEPCRSRCRNESTGNEENHSATEKNSYANQESRLNTYPSMFSDSQDVDDGFSEEDNKENVFCRKMKSGVTLLKVDSSPSVMEYKNANAKSPFTLHRRHSLLDMSPSVSDNRNSELTKRPIVEARQGKRPPLRESCGSDFSANNLSTTPKRRKSIGKLKRSLSGYPSFNFLSTGRPSAEPEQSDKLKLTSKITNDTGIESNNAQSPCLIRSHSELPRIDEKKVDRVIEAIDNFSLVRDSLSSHLLPTSDRHRFELMTVSVDNIGSFLMNKEERNTDIQLIDCRYPYEYNGGHVMGSVNIYTEEQIMEQLFYPALKRTTLEENCCFRLGNHDSIMADTSLHGISDAKTASHSPLQCSTNHVNQSRVLIFYCEFSSRRAPTLAKFLRGADRKANLLKYPYLFYPEIYIMSGGYHDFVQKYKHLCEPPGYVKMFDKAFATELGKYKRKTRKFRFDDRVFKRSPMYHGKSPLRLLGDEETRPHSSPPSPPRAIVWS